MHFLVRFNITSQYESYLLNVGTYYNFKTRNKLFTCKHDIYFVFN